jgi:hypothetical protein
MILPSFAVVPVTSAAYVLAAQPGDGDNGGQGDDFGKSSPVGFLLLLLFLIAVGFLVRSMTKHLKRVPASFDQEETEESADAETPPEVEAPAGAKVPADAKAKPANKS